MPRHTVPLERVGCLVFTVCQGQPRRRLERKEPARPAIPRTRTRDDMSPAGQFVPDSHRTARRAVSRPL